MTSIGLAPFQLLEVPASWPRRCGSAPRMRLAPWAERDLARQKRRLGGSPGVERKIPWSMSRLAQR